MKTLKLLVVGLVLVGLTGGAFAFEIPLDGIWKSTDGRLTFFLQKYQTGACVLVASMGPGTTTAFLSDDFAGELLSDGQFYGRDIDGGGYRVRFAIGTPYGGQMIIALPGMPVLGFTVVLEYPAE